MKLSFCKVLEVSRKRMRVKGSFVGKGLQIRGAGGPQGIILSEDSRAASFGAPRWQLLWSLPVTPTAETVISIGRWAAPSHTSRRTQPPGFHWFHFSILLEVGAGIMRGHPKEHLGWGRTIPDLVVYSPAVPFAAS